MKPSGATTTGSAPAPPLWHGASGTTGTHLVWPLAPCLARHGSAQLGMAQVLLSRVSQQCEEPRQG